MSKQSGPIVFTATAEMAKSMKVFKAGATYVAHRAVAVALGSNESTTTRRSTKKATTKKATTKVVAAKKKKKTKKKVAKKAIAKKVIKKAIKRSKVNPKMIVKFVRQNEGCNMTDIEGHTKLPQATIRRVLNSARELGSIRTEGQRRGLRYFSAAQQAAEATASSN